MNVAVGDPGPTNARVAVLAGLVAASLFAPMVLLLWMPIVLGVPHLANDIRYLILPLPRRQRAITIAACAAFVAVAAGALVLGAPSGRAEAVVGSVWLLAMIATSGRLRPAAMAIAPIAWLLVVVLPTSAGVVAVFAHNLIGIVAWVVVAKPDRRHALAIGGTLVVTTALAVLAGPAMAQLSGGDSTPWGTLDAAAQALFAGAPVELARGLVVAFVFLQAVHYAIWLAWIPRAVRTRRGNKRGFVLAIVGALTLVVIAAAVVDVRWTRTTYLSLAMFHIYLELVVLAARVAKERA
jgi:hypothetical protein